MSETRREWETQARRAFGAELLKLAAALKGQVTDPLLAVFWEEFSDVDADVFRQACVKARRTLDFFPSIRELRAVVESIRPRPRPIDPYLAKLLQPFERKEPWPAKGVAPMPPRPTPAPETEMERAIRERMRSMGS